MVRKLETLPERRGVWLWSYEDIKYKTPFQWFATGLLGVLALAFGSALAWVFWEKSRNATFAGQVWAEFFPGAIIAYGILNFPGAVIYFARRVRHEPVDVWDCETPNDVAAMRHHSQNEDPPSAARGGSLDQN